MYEAVALEASFINFFAQLEATIRAAGNKSFTSNYGIEEKKLGEFLILCQESVHKSLCDSFDTPSVLIYIQDLMSNSRIYLKNIGSSLPYTQLLKDVSGYILKLLKVILILLKISDLWCCS